MQKPPLSQAILIDPLIRSGKPYVQGTRITVADVLGYLASGMSVEQVCQDFPELSPATIQACLAFAASREHLLHQTSLA